MSISHCAYRVWLLALATIVVAVTSVPPAAAVNQLTASKLIDRQNFNDALNAFAFDSNKAAARKAVGLK